MKSRRITPAGEPLNAAVRLPGSKSITNRAMIAAALADGPSTLTGALFSDDTEYLIACLQSLGVRVTSNAASARIDIAGTGGNITAAEADLFCGNSGTTIRFCTALCTLGAGAYRLDGVDRMRQRPIGPLVDALRQLGAAVGYEIEEGHPPVLVRGGTLRTGAVTLVSPPSSQFVTALLLVAPYAMGDVFLDVRGGVVSAPYLAMTVTLMDAFGVAVVDQLDADAARFVVPAPQRYAGTEFAIEPDASNASYFLAAPAVTGGSVTVEGLGTSSIQGDVRFVDVLERMGCTVAREPHRLTVSKPPKAKLTGVDADLNAMPDTAQTLAVVALFADGRTTIRNVANLRLKETDRLAALAAELVKFGARVDVGDNHIAIDPPVAPQPAHVATYDDHRMAMSFALAGLALDGVEILDPACVNKTFPDFFERFDGLTAG